MSTLRTFRFLAVLGVAASTASAQQIQMRASPGVVVGVVSDTTGAPLENAEVVLAGEHRATVGPDGRFRFERVEPGRQTIAARRVGFRPLARIITVTDSGAIVLISLVPITTRLPAVVTAASRGGLSGKVADTAFKLLPGVDLYLVGADKRATTDSAGEFFMDAKPGHYMMSVRAEGFATRMVSVTVPRDSGRHVELQMRQSDRAASRRDANAISSLQARLIRRSPVYSKVYTAEDIAETNAKSLRHLAAAAAVQPVGEHCMVSLPAYAEMERGELSMAGQVPIWALDPNDIEFLEVYGTGRSTSQRQPARAARTPAPRMRPSSVPGCPSVIAWLKK